MPPYDCDMCEDTGTYRSYKVSDGGGGGRTIICDHKTSQQREETT